MEERVVRRTITLGGILGMLLLAVAVGCAGSITIPGIGQPAGNTAASGPVDNVRVVLLQGGQVFPVYVMQKMGIDKKYNLEIERRETVDTNASYNMLRTKEVDLGFGGWMTIAKLRTTGVDLLNIYSMGVVTNEIMVKNESSLRSYADLKGKRVGVFGGPAGTTTLILRLITMKFFGFDLLKDSQVQYSAPPLLVGLMEKGEIDAALLLDPHIGKMEASGKFRSIGDMGKIWEEKMGWPLLLVTINTTDEFANKNPRAVKNFVAAFKESVEYLQSHPEIWPELAAMGGAEGPEEVKLLSQRVGRQVLARWDDELIKQQLEFAKMAMEIGGPDVLPYIPNEAFTTKFVP